jgi:hypothetical protein
MLEDMEGAEVHPMMVLDVDEVFSTPGRDALVQGIGTVP